MMDHLNTGQRPPSRQSKAIATQRRVYLSMAALLGPLFASLLLAAPVGLLYENEVRAVDDHLGLGAAQSVTIEGSQGAPMEGRLVHLTGLPHPGKGLFDPAFGIYSPNALRLVRRVEMLQWVEHKDRRLVRGASGDPTPATVLRYAKEWREVSIDSSAFQEPTSHLNPPLPFHSVTFDNSLATLSGLRLHPSILAQMNDYQQVTIDPLTPAPTGYQVEANAYLSVNGKGVGHQVGDVKISFLAVPAHTYSLIGKVSGGVLSSYALPRQRELALATVGVVSTAQMFDKARHPLAHHLWGRRWAGLAMLFMGSLMSFGVFSLLALVAPARQRNSKPATFALLVASLGATLALCIAIGAAAWLIPTPSLDPTEQAPGDALFYAIVKSLGGTHPLPQH